jgi:tetratricopeptide (TPR) repeat protein
MRISEIRNSQQFQDFCQQLLAAEHADFEVLDDSGGDKGNDGYIPSQGRLFAIYCPEKYPPPKTYYQRKIRRDLAKAVTLRDKYGYQVNEWVFITPAPLTEEIRRYLARQVKKAGFVGISWSEKNLLPILRRHPELEPLFPELFAPAIRDELRTGFADVLAEQAAVRSSVDLLISQRTLVDNDLKATLEGRLKAQYEKRFESAKQKFEAGMFLQARDAFLEIMRDLKLDAEIKDPTLIARAYTNLGTCEWHAGNIDATAKYFEEAHAYNPDDVRCVANLASALMLQHDTVKALATVERALALEPDNEVAVATKANILLSEGRHDDAINFLTAKNRKSLSKYFEAMKYAYERDFEAAETIFRDLIAEERDNTEYQAHLAAIIVLRGQAELMDEHTLPWRMPLTLREAFAEADGLLSSVIQSLATKEAQQKLVAAFVNRSAVRMMLGRAPEAIADAQEAIRLSPECADAHLNLSKAESELGKYDNAVTHLERYVELAGGLKGRVRELAYGYYRTGQISKAKALLAQELDRELTINDLNLVGLAVYVYDLDQDVELADELVARVLRTFPDHPKALSMQARHLEDIGQEGAEALLRKGFDLAGPEDRELAALDLADYYYQHNRYAEALPLYEKLISEDEVATVNYRFLVCLYYSGKYHEVLYYAPRFRRSTEVDLEYSPVEAAAHKALEQLSEAAAIFLALYQKQPANIGYLVDYGVCVFRLGETEKAIKAFDQAKKKVALVRDLLSLARGYDRVGQSRTAIELAYEALQQQPNNPEVHRIYLALFFNLRYNPEVIGEKYAKAFEDSRDNFNRRFPEAKGFQMIDIIENPTFIQDSLRERVPGIAEIVEAYQQNRLPITSKAFLCGKDTFDSWTVLTDTRDLGLKASVPDVDEQRLELEAVTDEDEIVVDLLALYTLCRIGKLDLLPHLFPRIYIHQAAFDELAETLNEERKHVEKGRLYVMLNGAQLVRREISAEIIKGNVALLEKIEQFIKDQCEVTGLLKQPNEADQMLLEEFNDAAAYTAICASQLKAPLLSDDGLLRIPLRNSYQISGCSTQTLLRYAASREKLNQEELYDAQLELLKLQYRYIAVDDKLLIYAFNRVGYSPRAEFDLVLEEMGRREVAVESIAVTAGNFLKDLWLTSVPPVSKSLTLHRLLAAICQHHNPRKTLSLLLRYLRSQMNLVPHLFADIRVQTSQWLTIAVSQHQQQYDQ